MSDTKLKELPEAQSVGANDLLYLVASDTDYKVKGSTVKSFVEPAEMTGATSIAPGTKGLVPAPAVGDNTKYFKGNGEFVQPALSEMSDDATHRVVTDEEKGTWNGKANPSDIPTSLSQLTDDSTHRLVTDEEKIAWSGKQDALTFDDEPTDGSNNPVKSNGIYDALATKANSADLATVATTGDYEDLTNKPTIPAIEANPSGEATAEMQKLKIDSTIYKFAAQKAYGEITDVDIASFNDGAKDEPLAKLEVGIEAVQDLHGYDRPWPAGGGKNKIPSINQTQTINGVVWTLQSDGSIKLSETATGNSVYDFGRAEGLTLNSGSYFANENGTNYSVTIFKVVSGTVSVIKSGGGAFSIAEDSEIFMRVTVVSGATVNETLYPMIESGSTATSYAPYSNICPISGWTGAEIHNFGLPQGYMAVDYVTLSAPVIFDGITDFNRDDLCIITEFKVETVSNYGAIYSAYSAETNNATRLIQNGTSPNSLLVNNNAKANIPSTVAQSGGYIPNGFNKFISYHSSYNINGNTSSSSAASGNNNTATSLNLCSSSNSVSFRRFDIQSQRTEGGETIYTPLCSLIPCTNPQGVAGFWDAIGEKFYTTSDPTKITATGTLQKTPHIADVTYPITWSEAGEVYGGYIDYKRKKVVATWIAMDMGDISWAYSGSSQSFSVAKTNIGMKISDSAEYMSEIFPNTGTDEYMYQTTQALRVKYINYTTTSAFITMVTGHKVAFELDEPIEYDLDEPVPTITTLLGNNNILADSGQIKDVVYVRDLNTYLKSLDDRITALENA